MEIMQTVFYTNGKPNTFNPQNELKEVIIGAIEQVFDIFDYIFDVANRIRELIGYRNTEKPIDSFNHILDGARYITTYLIEESHRGDYNIW